MSYKTSITRNMRGELNAETIIPLAFESRELRISTHKQNRGIVTGAQVVVNKGDGCFSYVMFGDFTKTMATSQQRATVKTIAQQHEAALLSAESVLAEAIVFYTQRSGRHAFGHVAQ